MTLGRRRPFATLLLLLLILLAGAQQAASNRAPSATDTFVPIPAAGNAAGPHFGVVFISSAEGPADAQQYQNGLATGASWNRWPLYWYSIEVAPGQFDWSRQDAALVDDVAYGLQLNAILLGTPGFYTTSQLPGAARPPEPPPPGRLALQAAQRATPQGLYAPIFTDGTDLPGPGKQINPDNVWARFVHQAVNRYKPGGVLAQSQAWPAGVGVTHWEMWNEPDLPFFWDGSLADYARLLKVGYLATRQADPGASILFGGLANDFNYLSYYRDVLAIYDADPLAGSHAYFHDILATHSYFFAWRSWYHVDRAAQALAARGLAKPIWLNETGVPAWNDYPGPTWDPTSPLRATMSEQADFAIQSALYARYAGAEAIFHFQLYDGCGNQPQGTDFPPHNGELCDANGNLIGDPRFPCAGDANGLYRNPNDAACFTQHPQPESGRPNLAAFQVLTTHFQDVEPLWWQRIGWTGGETARQDWLAFYQPATGQRIVGLWAGYGQVETAVLPAINSQATLVTPDGNSQTILAIGGVYTVSLPAATNRNAFWDPNLYAIGGRPYLVIEPDAEPPTVTLSGPPVSGPYVPLSWSGDDGLGGGVANYDLAAAVDGGASTPWLTATTATHGAYLATPGHTYRFTAVSRDRAGNLSQPAVFDVTVIELNNHRYMSHVRYR